MPEPLLYLKSMGAAAVVSAIFVLAMAGMQRSISTTRLNSACVLGLGLGLAVGCYLSLRLAWPPANGLERFVMIVIPAGLGIELIAGFQSVPGWVAWLLRTSLAAIIPRILLHDSVYLDSSGDEWTRWQAATTMTACAALLAVVWALLARLSRRSAGASVSFALSLTTMCAGLTVMMAGYIKGGAAAFPLAATLVAVTLVVPTIGPRRITKSDGATVNGSMSTITGCGVVGLFGVLFIGRFFGRLSTGFALAILLAPLLCWATETPLLRHQKPWLVVSIRLLLVAIPLLIVLTLAKRGFDRDMAPLLGNSLYINHCALMIGSH